MLLCVRFNSSWGSSSDGGQIGNGEIMRRKKFAFIVSFLITFLIVTGGGVFAANLALDRMREESHFDWLAIYLEAEMRDRVRAQSYQNTNDQSLSDDELDITVSSAEPLVMTPEVVRPNAINFLLVGLDRRRLADAIIVGSLHRDTGDINLMSVPRDLRISLTEERQAEMLEHSRWVPQNLKINEVRALGGRVEGLDFMVDELSEVLGVPIDYYVEIRLDAFKRVVDAIGGVDFFVPRDMFYEDPYQDLFIDLRRGQQRLNGTAAEGLVRFRDHDGPGWNRDAMQVQFMQAVFNQTLSRQGFLNNPLSLINIVLSEVRTNAGLSVVQYIPLIPTVADGEFTTHVLPGRGRIVEGIYFFVPDAEESPEVLRKVFFLDTVE